MENGGRYDLKFGGVGVQNNGFLGSVNGVPELAVCQLELESVVVVVASLGVMYSEMSAWSKEKSLLGMPLCGNCMASLPIGL